VNLMKKGAVATIGASAAAVALTAAPALAAPTLSPNPYPVPQSSPGVPDLNSVAVQASGLTVGTQYYATYCDGLPITNAAWSATTDCGPFSGANTAPSSGNLTFGGDPATSTSTAAFELWHGDAANSAFGEQPFNCLAPDDNPQSTATTDGNQPIDPNEAAWGATAPVGATQGGGSAPCNVLVSTVGGLGANSSNSVEDPVNLVAQSQVPESRLAIELPIGGAVLFLGAGAYMARRRHHRTAAA
jgi:hypothetical protein